MVVDDQELEGIVGRTPADGGQFLLHGTMDMLRMMIHVCSLSFIKSVDLRGEAGQRRNLSANGRTG